MVVVLAILGIVIAALTQLFVSASTAQVDMTRRFEAQQEMRLALDKLRREIHCASAVSGAPGSSIVITLGSYCPTRGTGPAEVTWCTKDKNGAIPDTAAPTANPPYSLWRHTGAVTCTAGTGRKVADYLTTGRVFTGHVLHGGGSLGKLSVHLPVDVKPADAKQRYVLEDDIVLRNTSRS
jgi:type II secretory pathway pseudopilin PulG